MSIVKAREALNDLARFIDVLEIYEEVLFDDQLLVASQSIIGLEKSLRNITPTPECQSEFDILREQVVEARLRIVAFSPFAQSKVLQHLRQRQSTVRYLQELQESASTMLDACSNDEPHM